MCDCEARATGRLLAPGALPGRDEPTGQVTGTDILYVYAPLEYGVVSERTAVEFQLRLPGNATHRFREPRSNEGDHSKPDAGTSALGGSAL